MLQRKLRRTFAVEAVITAVSKCARLSHLKQLYINHASTKFRTQSFLSQVDFCLVQLIYGLFNTDSVELMMLLSQQISLVARFL